MARYRATTGRKVAKGTIVLTLARKKAIFDFADKWIALRRERGYSDEQIQVMQKSEEYFEDLSNSLSRNDKDITPEVVRRWIRTHKWITDMDLQPENNNRSYNRSKPNYSGPRIIVPLEGGGEPYGVESQSSSSPEENQEFQLRINTGTVQSGAFVVSGGLEGTRNNSNNNQQTMGTLLNNGFIPHIANSTQPACNSNQQMVTMQQQPDLINTPVPPADESSIRMEVEFREASGQNPHLNQPYHPTSFENQEPQTNFSQMNTRDSHQQGPSDGRMHFGNQELRTTSSNFAHMNDYSEPHQQQGPSYGQSFENWEPRVTNFAHISDSFHYQQGTPMPSRSYQNGTSNARTRRMPDQSIENEFIPEPLGWDLIDSYMREAETELLHRDGSVPEDAFSLQVRVRQIVERMQTVMKTLEGKLNFGKTFHYLDRYLKVVDYVAADSIMPVSHLDALRRATPHPPYADMNVVKREEEGSSSDDTHSLTLEQDPRSTQVVN